MGSYRPPFMAYRVAPVPIWSWVPRCPILGNPWAKKMLIYDYCSIYITFFALKSLFLRFLTPLLRPKVPPWSPYGLIPLRLCIPKATNQNTEFVCEFGSFFFIFSNCNASGAHFWPFLTPPLYPILGLGSPYGP